MLSPHVLREVAVKAMVDPRTVKAYLNGKKTRSTTRATLEKAIGEIRPDGFDDARHPREVYPDIIEADGCMFAAVPDENVNDLDLVFIKGAAYMCLGHRFNDCVVVWDLKAIDVIDYLVDVVDDLHGRAVLLKTRRSNQFLRDRVGMKEEL